MLSAKAERGLPPVRERERERERKRERDSLIYECKHANKAMVSPEKMSFLFFS